MFIKVWAYASSNVGLGLYKRKMPNYVELQTWRNSPTVLSDCSHTSRIKQPLPDTKKTQMTWILLQIHVICVF